MPEPERGHAVGQALVLLAAGFLLYIVLWYVLDPPPTYSCSEPWPAELRNLNERRSDFLLVALPLLTGYGGWLGSTACRAAAARNRRREKPARPGAVAIAFATVLVPIWVFLIGDAFLDEKVGGSLFYGFLLGAAGLTLVGLCVVALCILVLGAAQRPSWLGHIESTSVLMLWTGLLSVLPGLCVLAAIPGKDATLFC